MKQTVLLTMAMVLFVLTACMGNTQSTDKMDGVSEIITVDIFTPERILPQEEVVLEVKVTQGKENIEDAQEVEFEIWKHAGRDEGEMIEAALQGEGIYQVTHTFIEDGVYYVQTHVTARDMHIMPTKQMIVGDVSEAELEALEDEDDVEEMESGGHSGH
ncbi:FixH family protein [Halalkalibacter alkalisediminis]|uniref:FixH family protein n=1 Tax=Halalkalibacter alkalisediminis TaxID=935616 RepID=A0ABV6NDP1_9BACI|nr:FixH family protein [Halalkalibacter alkalisediminis]